MIRVLINGINGRMGQEVFNAINKDENFMVISGIDKVSSQIQVPVYNDVKFILEKPDVIIDFSTPEATFNIFEYAKENKIPIVIATTGFTNEQKLKIEEYSKIFPIFMSSNMSYEINLMCDMVSELAQKLNDVDIEIVETHHRNKIDSPSGTALMLADSINESLENSMEYMYDRHSIKQKRKDNEIGIHSIRGGTEVGKHSVIFFGENESFEITHTITSRSIFAKGALKAAEFIIKQSSGLYNMKDL